MKIALQFGEEKARKGADASCERMDEHVTVDLLAKSPRQEGKLWKLALFLF